MASNGAIPPPIGEVAEDAKFDDGVKTSWITVRRKIISTLKSQGLVAYADGTVNRPLKLLLGELRAQMDATAAEAGQSPITSHVYPPIDAKLAPTPVYSLEPSYKEWRFRNDRGKTIIEAHMEDILTLVPDFDNLSAVQDMLQLNRDFESKSDILRIETNHKLRAFRYDEVNTFKQFFKDIHELRKKAVEAGNTYSDDEFGSILL
ncbi:hypothetical protein PQX77_002104 [Marasmius sp. AFHP31]|nr:hypothetical protein PQX77_002104 [Marasmius sp. AFHP31]